MFTDIQIVSAIVVIAILLLSIASIIGVQANNAILQELQVNKHYGMADKYYKELKDTRRQVREDRETIKRLVKENDELKQGNISEPVRIPYQDLLQDSQQDYQDLKNFYDKKCETSTKLKKSEKRCAKLVDKLNKATGHIEEATAKIESLNTENATISDSCKNLIDQRDTAYEHKRTMESRFINLTDKIKVMGGMYQAIESVNDIVMERNTAIAERNMLKSTNNGLDSVIADRDNMIQELIIERDKAQFKVNEIDEGLKKSVLQCTKHYRRTEELTSIVDGLHSSLAGAVNKRDNLASTLIEVQKELQESKSKVERLQDDNQKLINKISTPDAKAEKQEPPAESKAQLPAGTESDEDKELYPESRSNTPNERALMKSMNDIYRVSHSENRVHDIRVELSSENNRQQYKVRIKVRKLFHDEGKWTNTIHFAKESGKVLKARDVLNVIHHFI